MSTTIEDEAINYPEAAKTAREGFYIDALITEQMM